MFHPRPEDKTFVGDPEEKNQVVSEKIRESKMHTQQRAREREKEREMELCVLRSGATRISLPPEGYDDCDDDAVDYDD